jgi:Fructose-2,6-bisphosphatase
MRHTDRSPPENDLNPTGIARAAALPAALADLPIDAIYISDFRRNRDSAAPLAAARGLTPEVLATDDSLPYQLAALSQGRTVVWIGNSFNLEPLWEALALPDPPPTTYGEIAIVTATEGAAEVARRRFEP